MIEIIIIMCAGIFSGIFLRGKKSILALLDKVTLAAIYLLLFLLGLSVGIDEYIISSFPVIGFSAIVLTLSAIAGSVFFSWILYLSLFRKKGDS